MQNHPIPAPKRPDLRMLATKAVRSETSNDRPMGFTRRELRRLVADMIG